MTKPKRSCIFVKQKTKTMTLERIKETIETYTEMDKLAYDIVGVEMTMTYEDQRNNLDLFKSILSHIKEDQKLEFFIHYKMFKDILRKTGQKHMGTI